MIATQDRTRCLAGARLLDRAVTDLHEARNLCAFAGKLLERARRIAGGSVTIGAQDLAELRLFMNGLDGDAADALLHLNAAAKILRRAD